MSELTLLIVIYIYRFIKMSGLRSLLSFTKVSGQILHNNYTHNLESNSIVLFGANDYTIGLALSLEPRLAFTFLHCQKK